MDWNNCFGHNRIIVSVHETKVNQEVNLVWKENTQLMGKLVACEVTVTCLTYVSLELQNVGFSLGNTVALILKLLRQQPVVLHFVLHLKLLLVRLLTQIILCWVQLALLWMFWMACIRLLEFSSPTCYPGLTWKKLWISLDMTAVQGQAQLVLKSQVMNMTTCIEKWDHSSYRVMINWLFTTYHQYSFM